MSISVADFWRLIAESGLLTAVEIQQAASSIRPEAASDLQQVARGLVQSGKLSRYQAKILLAGKPGPFVYGDYVVYDRAEGPRLAGLFRARHLPTNHPVCLMFLAGAALNDPQALARLTPQVAVARQASQGQPRLSGCYQFVDLGKFKFLVVESLKGDTLEAWLTKSSTKLTISAASRIVRSVAQGLVSFHSLGQAHGHIRPANLWLNEDGSAKVLQFPLISDPLETKAPPATVAAQIDYLAPELATPASLADSRSDVYSLGCLLFTLLAEQPPFAGGERGSKLGRDAQEVAAAIAKLDSHVPVPLRQVLTYMLQKDPARRYADASAVADALQAFSGGDPHSTAEPTLAAYESWLQNDRNGGSAVAAQTSRPACAPVAVARAVSANGGAPKAPTVQPAAQLAAVQAVPVAPAQAGVFPAATAVQPLATAVLPSRGAQPSVATPVVGVVASTSATAAVAGRRGKKRGQTAMTLGVIAGAVVLLSAVAWYLGTQQETIEKKPGTVETAGATSPEKDASAIDDDETDHDSNSLDAHVADTAAAGKEPIQSIGERTGIWQSPTEGEPIDLAWLPPGVQAIVALRPAELTQQSEWEKLSDQRTLGAVSQWLTDDLPKTTGQTLDKIETVLVGLLDGSPGPPKVALVARSSDPFSLDDLQTAWGEARPEQVEGQEIHTQSGRAFCLPDKGDGKLLVIAPAAELREMVKSGGEPPPLRRELEVLAASSDDQRQLTLLVAPNFPLTDGKALFVDEGAKLIEPLRVFLEMEDSDGKLDLTKAAMLSGHVSETLFIELRLYNNFDQPTQSAARKFRSKLTELPRQVSRYVRDLALSNYSKPVLWDFKDQLDVLTRFTRVGVEGKQIVLRAYLPSLAAHNLALGAHLALLENPGAGGAVAPGPSPVPVAKKQSLADKLKKRTSLTFPNNALEKSVQLLADDIGFEFVILGNDLREEGITKNQSLKDFDEQDKPADEILRKIMIKADPAGRLVYVIKPNEGGGEEVVYITTRGAAKKRGDKLPPELETK